MIKVLYEDSLVDALAYSHHKIVQIHPFTNGNGRVARLVTNLLAYLNGYQAVYHREGNAREAYIKAIKKADNFDYQPLRSIIQQQLHRL